ncbi:diadenosine tetraphosphate hydrolase [Skermania piniformis]|uniref:Diadenosine tetraphosphate hydrolase n=1 Tax=Skermania pinensis TaxID=39122 RepID=A0ABX8S9P7_9ACTN|nr:diadenosine tetraphosphate hydrolase [Skermania piniformis]QXQ14579.1 diadenosine tetraphosphate hydrolase [Skermania piniformis]
MTEPDTDFRRDPVGTALRGTNPTVLRRLPGSFAAFGFSQFLPGYCVLLTDRPGIGALADLDRTERMAFLTSMDLLATAIETACRAVVGNFRRMNLEILGNTDEFLHAHLWPRYHWEPAEYQPGPVWFYPPDRWSAPEQLPGPEHDRVREAICTELDRLTDLDPR